MNDVVMRRVKNIEEVRSIWWELDAAFDPPQSTTVDFDAMVDKFARYGITVACENAEGALLGAVTLYANDTSTKVAYISSLAVSPNARGMGLGSRALCAAEDIARAAGMNRVRLSVRCDNDQAISFYRKHGYKDEETGATVASRFMSRPLY